MILAIISLYYMPFDPLIAGVLYLLSGLLDAFDGYAARALDQGNSCLVREVAPYVTPLFTLQALCLALCWTW